MRLGLDTHRGWMARLLVLASVAVTALAASSSTAALRDELKDLAAQNEGVVPLTPELFNRITDSNREWSVTVQFTALSSKMKCQPCRQFDPHYKVVAKAWSTVNPEQRDQHFFATLDFDNAMDTFKRLGLVTAPVLYTYPAAKGPRRPASGRIEHQQYDFHTSGFEADVLAEQLSQYTPTKIPYSAPFNWGLLITSGVGLLTFLASLKFILPLLSSRWTWGVLCIALIVIYNSGFMFSRIRDTPYVGRGAKGQPSWIANGFQNQYTMEHHVVAAIYGTLAFSYTALIFMVPRVSSPSKQRFVVYIWCTVILILVSILLSFFHVKNPVYPFRLFI